jgi:xanthine dehydrogenase small subunit
MVPKVNTQSHSSTTGTSPDGLRPVRFHHRGRTVELDAIDPTRSVLDWLREEARCTGTKEGCNEGDCGACTVVVGELSPEAQGGLALRTVNACIQFLPSLDGRALFTVEDLKPLAGGELHPVQQALVECHGSQCGFCTPGFVMSLWSVYEHHQACGTRPGRQALAHALSGNLCRCTGYRPILDAGERMFEAVPVLLDPAPVVDALRALQRDDAEAVCHGRPGGPTRFHAPRSLRALAELRQRLPQALLLAGCTDIGLWVNKQFKPLGEDLVSLGRVAELRRIEAQPDGALSIGAAASLEDAWRALAGRHPELAEVWLRFASPPIRHAGTLGGNVANGSPIGDAAPVLMALDAQVELRRGDTVRRLPLSSFYVGYMKNQLVPGEFVQALAVPPARPGLIVRAYKISKRFDSDISALCAGLSIALEEEGGPGQEPLVAHVRLAFGGMAATVQRAAHAEAALAGRPWSQASVRAAQQALSQDFTPMSDLRASAAHRLQVARNLLQRFWLETRADDPLPPEAVRVWPVIGIVTEGPR